jgi:hypothetical protein
MRTLLLVLLLPVWCSVAQWQSSLVWYATDGRLQYARDGEGNGIPDFSYAGYRNGTVPIPDVPVVKTIGPTPGDNTAWIQAALDEVGGRTADVSGFRGALLLGPGLYRVQGTLRIPVSGVVLRGSGDGADTTLNTVLLAVGDTPHQRPVIVAGGGSETKWSDQIPGTKVNITSDTVPVGSRSFTVADAAPFSVGDNIIISHPCTAEWLRAIDYGGTAGDTLWQPGEQPIPYNRMITAISGNTITVDAPVFTTLLRALAQSFVYRTARTGIRTRIGIEDLRVHIEAAGVPTDTSGDENHAWDAVRLVQIEDAWVRRCTALGFGQAGFETATATRVTIDSCRAIDPVSLITGERRYNFNVYTASQLILFRGCRADYARHAYISNGSSWTSGCVFLHCSARYSYAASEGHRRWSTGLLFDNLRDEQPSANTILLGLYNRGDYGTGHGWGSAHSVAWNCDVGTGSLVVQKPPTAQNYAIGCAAATVTGRPPVAPFDQPEGWIEGTNQPGLRPASLYEAQREGRLIPSAVAEPRGAVPGEYRLEQNYPNPFNPVTTVPYYLPAAGDVRLAVYDLAGREVIVLADEAQHAGWHCSTFDASGLASGIYVCRLRSRAASIARSMVLIR